MFSLGPFDAICKISNVKIFKRLLHPQFAFNFIQFQPNFMINMLVMGEYSTVFRKTSLLSRMQHCRIRTRRLMLRTFRLLQKGTVLLESVRAHNMYNRCKLSSRKAQSDVNLYLLAFAHRRPSNTVKRVETCAAISAKVPIYTVSTLPPRPKFVQFYSMISDL